MSPLEDVFLWALIPTVAMFIEVVVFTSRTRYRKRTYAIAGISAVLLFEIPRVFIPFLPQPGLGLEGYIAWGVGGIIFLFAVAFSILTMYQLKKGERGEGGEGGEGGHSTRKMQTTGVYGIVRHPMYFGDVLWPVGWSIMFNAGYALALTPLWFILRLSFSILEEEKLIADRYGEEYVKYQQEVPKRIIPGII
ncbi:MAG: isoprenylcysteine carboxylmethyltransferase family protein [Archaeoglobaceae archaeon]